MSLNMGCIMRILFVLMFLASNQSHAFTPASIEVSDEFVEAASPACKEILSTMQTCRERGEARFRWLCGDRPQARGNVSVCKAVNLPPLPPCPASMAGYLACERQKTQRQLQETQRQLQETQRQLQELQDLSQKLLKAARGEEVELPRGPALEHLLSR